MTQPRVVIIGGGFAGLSAAKALARAEAEVVLIDKQNHHLFQPLLYQVATASLSPGNIAAPIRRILGRQANCSVLMVPVTKIDVDEQTVELGSEPYSFDYLVAATGAETNYFGNDSWKQFAPGLKTIDEAVEIRSRFLLAFEQAEIEPDEETRKSVLTFAIVGAGPTGVEMAAALADIVATVRQDFRNVDTRTARILLIDFADRILNTFDPKLSQRALADLESLGVEVVLSTKVSDIDDSGLTAETPDGVVRIDANNIIWAAGVKASPLGESLGTDLDRGGRVLVAADLTIPEHSNVFVAGDLAHAIDPSTGEMVPGVAQGALQMGNFAGKVIAAEIAAKRSGRPIPERPVFKYHDKGSLAIIGKNRAVAEIGRLRFGGMFAFLTWAFVHILALIGFRRKLIVFTEWAWQYLTKGRGVRLITGRKNLRKPVRPPRDSQSGP